jgi:hypothetical protein
VLVSSYDLVLDALKRHEEFSNGFGQAMGGDVAQRDEFTTVMKEGYPTVDTLLTTDPPAIPLDPPLNLVLDLIRLCCRRQECAKDSKHVFATNVIARGAPQVDLQRVRRHLSANTERRTVSNGDRD